MRTPKWHTNRYFDGVFQGLVRLESILPIKRIEPAQQPRVMDITVISIRYFSVLGIKIYFIPADKLKWLTNKKYCAILPALSSTDQSEKI